MGACDSTIKIDSEFNQRREDEDAFDISNDYLLPDNIASKTPISEKYQLLKIIGKGTTGIVSLGKDNTGKLYAIKSIRKKDILKSRLVIEEAQIGLQLNHPNLVKMKEVFEDSKKIYFVTELVNGIDLFDFIQNSPGKKLNDSTATEIIIQILDCLDYLHNKRHIAHRDIKPENFLVTVDINNNKPIVKLADFGFAKQFFKGEKFVETLGTLSYCAPEIISKIPYDQKVDLWSTGVVLYNMLTGYSPFTGNDDGNTKQNILSRNVNFDIIQNKNLKILCMGLLERNSENRLDVTKALYLAKCSKRKF